MSLFMLWLDSLVRAPALPCVWLIDTGQRPFTRPERTELRHATSRAVIALQAAAHALDIRIVNEPSGRPVIRAERLDGLHLSHATRGGMVAVALAEGPVGVDVEEIGVEPIPLLALHRAEQIWLNQIAEPGRAAAFAQLWAVKEAYGKWAGVGLGEPDSFAALPTPEGAWRVTGAPAAQIATRMFEANGRRFAAAAAVSG
jgi:4'-phosphopantetheinyl transferase